MRHSFFNAKKVTKLKHSWNTFRRVWFRLNRCVKLRFVAIRIYLHNTERMTDAPSILSGEFGNNAGWIALQPNEAWLSCADGRNLIVLVKVLHPLHASLEDEASVGEVADIKQQNCYYRSFKVMRIKVF